jgi:hypothetical protein
MNHNRINVPSRLTSQCILYVSLVIFSSVSAFGLWTASGATSASPAEPDATGLSELDRASFLLEPTARKLWPGSFGGIWGNAGRVPPKLYVAFTEDAEEKIAILAEDFPVPEMLEPVTVRHSLNYLENLQLKLIAERESDQDAEDPLAEANGGNYDLGIDYEGNAVRVITPSDVEAARTSVNAAYGDAVEVEEGGLSQPRACSDRFHCGLQLRAGIGTEFLLPGTKTIDKCTDAFTVVRPGGAIQILSAGHCGDLKVFTGNDVGNGRYHRGSIIPANLYGSVQDQYKGGRVDAERHSIGNGFTGNPWIYLFQENQAFPIKSVGTWEGIIVNGGQLCKGGIGTGYSCGYVKDKELSPWYITNGNRFLGLDAYSSEGDSGAPFVYGWSQAEAILSGGQGGACGCWTIAGHIQYADETLGVTPLLSP